MKHTRSETGDLSHHRVVLITGASSGIGKACADHLCQKGYFVYGTSRRVPSDYTEGLKDLHTGCPKMIQMDVRDDASVEQGIDLILRQKGRLDVVVNNAGFGIVGSVEDSSVEDVKDQFETNFFGVVRVCRAVLPHMRQQGSGYVVNISSLGGLMAIPFQGVYSASKFALEGLTEALRMEVKPFGINVSLIEPGDFKTGFTAGRVMTKQSRHNGAYAVRFKRALDVMEKAEISGPGPYRLARLLERIINHPSPRLRYTAGLLSQRFSVFLKKIMPSSFFEQMVLKAYKCDD